MLAPLLAPCASPPNAQGLCGQSGAPLLPPTSSGWVEVWARCARRALGSVVSVKVFLQRQLSVALPPPAAALEARRGGSADPLQRGRHHLPSKAGFVALLQRRWCFDVVERLIRSKQTTVSFAHAVVHCSNGLLCSTKADSIQDPRL